VATAPDMHELARRGVACVVATRDGELRPAVARAWAPVLADDGGTLQLCVEAPAGSPTRANLEDGTPLAVTLVLPSSYVSIQLKGRVTAIAELDDADHARVAAHGDAFAAETAAVGLAESIARVLRGSAEYVRVDVALAERFDQTPGPGAGRRL
jgi:hypothetical protein